MRQLEFNLTSRDENRASIETWKYRFTKSAMVEELGRTRYIYGLWEKLFGCWQVDIRTNKSREIIPTWAPLNPNGVWRDHLEIRTTGVRRLSQVFPSRWRYEANAAFAGLFSGIPQRIRSVVGPLGRYQWLALDLIWQQPDFARFLDEEIFNGTEQFVLACFTLAEGEKFLRTERNEFARMLMRNRRTELLSAISGVDCGKATLRALNKLGDDPCYKSVYQAVIECMADGKTAKAFSHAEAIYHVSVEALNTLPREFLLPNIAWVFLTDFAAAQNLYRLMDDTSGSSIRVLVGIFPGAPGDLRERAMHSLTRVRNFAQFLKWTIRWEKRFSEAVEFPSPPVCRRGPLVPLTSTEAMRDEALQMQNCLAGLISSVIDGDVYFCHWDGGERATVKLGRGLGTDWRFEQVLGFDNEPLGEQTESYIRLFVERLLHEQNVPDNQDSHTGNDHMTDSDTLVCSNDYPGNTSNILPGRKPP